MTGSDTRFGMKRLCLKNWRQPEIPNAFGGITEEAWVKRVMEPALTDAVPEEVTALFEVARGSMLYGWFFYPLLTLASEQLHRVEEAAVRSRCKSAGIPLSKEKNGRQWDVRLEPLIRELNARGVIPPDMLEEWNAVRSLRNSASHPKQQSIFPPGMTIASIGSCARRINQLFSNNKDYFSHLGARVRRATGLDRVAGAQGVVVGIDVGGARKGYHLVALDGSVIRDIKATIDPVEAARWCGSAGARLVAIDAPCGWCAGGTRNEREAEHILRELGFSAHSTPTRAKARRNPFYGWMLNGERIYRALRAEYPLFRGEVPNSKFCFETYPFLATCALAGRMLSADDKVTDRRDILRAAGIDITLLGNIDFVDAAICALVAYSVGIDYCVRYGNPEEGFILAPPR